MLEKKKKIGLHKMYESTEYWWYIISDSSESTFIREDAEANYISINKASYILNQHHGRWGALSGEINHSLKTQAPLLTP